MVAPAKRRSYQDDTFISSYSDFHQDAFLSLNNIWHLPLNTWCSTGVLLNPTENTQQVVTFLHCTRCFQVKPAEGDLTSHQSTLFCGEETINTKKHIMAYIKFRNVHNPTTCSDSHYHKVVLVFQYLNEIVAKQNISRFLFQLFSYNE